jgi:Arc/MetJ family transcription regulator
VYHERMSRTNIEIDDELIGRVMRAYRFRTKREAVEYALRSLVGTGDRKAILKLKGTGWEGDLEEMRRSRVEEMWAGTWDEE